MAIQSCNTSIPVNEEISQTAEIAGINQTLLLFLELAREIWEASIIEVFEPEYPDQTGSLPISIPLKSIFRAGRNTMYQHDAMEEMPSKKKSKVENQTLYNIVEIIKRQADQVYQVAKTGIKKLIKHATDMLNASVKSLYSSFDIDEFYQKKTQKKHEEHVDTITQRALINVSMIFRLIKTKASKWDEIGRELNVPFELRDKLRKDITTTDEYKLEKILHEWEDSCCSEFTWDNVINVLKEINLKRLAMDVEDHLRTEL